MKERDVILAHARGDNSKNILIIANRGLYANCMAKEAARFMLCTGSRSYECDCPSCRSMKNHPDITVIKAREGKQQVTVEDVSEALERTENVPALGRRRVVIVDGIDRCTEKAANLFLKVMEDKGYVSIISIAYTDTVLETIASRSAVVRLMPFDRDSFLSWAERTGVEDGDFWYIATAGCPHLAYEIKEDGAEEAFRKALPAAKKDMKMLLTSLHMFREKDRESFFTAHRGLVTALLDAFREQEIADVRSLGREVVTGNDAELAKAARRIRCLSEAIKESRKATYTAGDLLNALIFCYGE